MSFLTIVTILGAIESKAAPICTPNMDPLKCGEAQLTEAASILGQYKSEIARLDFEITRLNDELRRVTQGVPPGSVSWKTGTPLRGMVNNQWNKARATCDDGYVVVGGVCGGSPIGVVHPMTAVEDKRTFLCDFFLNAHDGNPNRELIATAACLKERTN
jgi:hypothetical protein